MVKIVKNPGNGRLNNLNDPNRPQCVNIHGTFVPKNYTVSHFTSLQSLHSLHFKIKSLHKNHVSSPHITTLHITSFIYTQSPLQFPLFVTTFLTLFLNVFSLQGRDAVKPEGTSNWSQLLMVLFTKEYLFIFPCETFIPLIRLRSRVLL